ncbi:MAG TPA: hypothetical protein VF021_04595 [Longimicrobiales bacterium]
MDHPRKLSVPAYTAVAVLLLLPCLEFVQAVSPLSPTVTQWRVIAVGLLSRVLVTPLLALLIAHVVAVLLEQRRTLRVFAVLNGAFALLLVLGVALFALDAAEVRVEVAPQSRPTYEFGVLLAFAKLGLAFVLLVVLSITEWQAAARLKRRFDRAGAAAPLFPARAPRPHEAAYAATGTEIPQPQ